MSRRVQSLYDIVGNLNTNAVDMANHADERMDGGANVEELRENQRQIGKAEAYAEVMCMIEALYPEVG